MRKLLTLIFALLLTFSVSEAWAEEPELIDNWAADSPAMQSIVQFVTDSVDEASDGYIPKADRVAVFDMDGTLYGERFPTYFNDWLFIQRALYDDSFEAPEELKAFAQAWEDKVLRGVPIDDFDAKERELGPQLYEGLTPEVYAEVVRKFKALPVYGFENMTYGEAYFQPMVSLVKYLYDHDYTVYIVSATYRDAVRVMTEGVLDEWIPADHVIGTDVLYVASGDANEDSMFYELMPEDELVVAGRLWVKNQKTNKATAIQREIGKMPVLAFGNSTGDFSMATYTLQNKKYGGRAYMLLCDDTAHDYGDPAAAAAFKAKCDANGFYTISEKAEFETLYPHRAYTVLSALGVTDYRLPGTVESRTPIGCKLLFETWLGVDGEEYARVRLVYQSTEQLRDLTALTPENPPVSFAIDLPGLARNADGFYRLEDVTACLQNAIDAYDELIETYRDESMNLNIAA